MWIYIGRANLIAGILLVVACILTIRQPRQLWWLAAGFFSAGTLVSIGTKVYLWLVSLAMAVGLSDSDPAEFPWQALILPIAASIYGITSVVLLWPWISQKNAICFGKILHLILFPLLFLMFLIIAFLARGQSQAFPELQWLVYGPIWFRIRESFSKEGGSH